MKTYDLIVVGGGFAGCAAAISAARAGASVLLLEKSNALGGAAVNSLVHPFMPNATRVNGQMLALSQGIFQEICAQLPGGKLHDETLKLLLNRMVLGAGAEILFHATVIDAARRETGWNASPYLRRAGGMRLPPDSSSTQQATPI